MKIKNCCLNLFKNFALNAQIKNKFKMKQINNFI